MKISLPSSGRAGFTLTELLVVITIIVLLFALTVGGFTYAQRSASRSRTQIALTSIVSGLNNYNTDFGGYPEPESPAATIEIAQKTYRVGSAQMLYQALSGDGVDQIRGANTEAAEARSDGDIDEKEGANVKLKDMPKEIWAEMTGVYFMVDGFGKPFQYTRGVPVDPTGVTQTPNAETVNPTFDLWSYGEDEENITAFSVDTLTDPTLKQASMKWIKNW